ncbi:16S rRNA (cytosine(1402)-N(4))-methyltransferase RsmH [Candidatus Uhrbacteria bacterium]|nr:16S rRNA (cytosine(1402)-N(4))-methyltransferase RsmH [Candidatus Uhrbacteria bacterium]
MTDINKSIHNAVMVREVLTALHPHPEGRYLDATLGGATHSLEILKASAPTGQLLSLDVDPTALARGKRLKKEIGPRWRIMESNFRHIRDAAEKSKMIPFDGIVFDLGISSDQLANPSKGLSFQEDGPLDMRLGPKANQDALTAADIVNSWNKSDLTKCLKNFGEERFAARIADAIISRRRIQKITKTKDLASVVASVVPRQNQRMRLHPATKTFQALRIAVNDELESLRVALNAAWEILAPCGAIAVISFHSLEDRIVKQTFKSFADAEVSKKPILPSSQEIKQNPRARSAKLRIAYKQNQNKLCPEVTLLL